MQYFRQKRKQKNKILAVGNWLNYCRWNLKKKGSVCVCVFKGKSQSKSNKTMLMWMTFDTLWFRTLVHCLFHSLFVSRSAAHFVNQYFTSVRSWSWTNNQFIAFESRFFPTLMSLLSESRFHETHKKWTFFFSKFMMSLNPSVQVFFFFKFGLELIIAQFEVHLSMFYQTGCNFFFIIWHATKSGLCIDSNDKLPLFIFMKWNEFLRFFI